MWEFIKYCLYCFLMVIVASNGDNPKGITLKNITVGIVTMVVLVGLGLGILWLLGVIVEKFRK